MPDFSPDNRTRKKFEDPPVVIIVDDDYSGTVLAIGELRNMGVLDICHGTCEESLAFLEGKSRGDFDYLLLDAGLKQTSNFQRLVDRAKALDIKVQFISGEASYFQNRDSTAAYGDSVIHIMTFVERLQNS